MKVLGLLFLSITLCYAAEFGRYSPSSQDDGRYIPDNSGQYIPDYSGLYVGDGSGRYAGDRSGDYRDNLLGSGTQKVFKQVPINPEYSIFKNFNTGPAAVAPRQVNTYNANKEGQWKILHQLGDFDTDGGYHWEYDTENKIQAEESGKLFNKGTAAEGIKAKGFFQYTGADNVVYSVTYTADENGFIPEGKHLPTPPPIPAAILRSLKYQ